MFEVLQIADKRPWTLPNEKEPRIFGLDLRDLLPLVAAEGPTLHWTMIPGGEKPEMLAVDYVTQGDKLQALATAVDEAENGVPFTWQELEQLAATILQTSWGTFVGAQDPSILTEISSLFLDRSWYIDRATERFYNVVDLAFQAVDNSYWLVYAKDPQIQNRVRTAFKSVKSLPGMTL